MRLSEPLPETFVANAAKGAEQCRSSRKQSIRTLDLDARYMVGRWRTCLRGLKCRCRIDFTVSVVDNKSKTCTIRRVKLKIVRKVPVPTRRKFGNL